eukprot:11178979-Lingulodinium_polyedra.AAC.1
MMRNYEGAMIKALRPKHNAENRTCKEQHPLCSPQRRKRPPKALRFRKVAPGTGHSSINTTPCAARGGPAAAVAPPLQESAAHRAG